MHLYLVLTNGLSISPIFCSMIGIANSISETELRLSDTSLETGSVLDLFFGLVYYGRPCALNVTSISEIRLLVLLLEKYGCLVHTELLKNVLARSLLSELGSGKGVFVLAAIMNDIDLCHIALKSGRRNRNTWETDNSSLHNSLKGGHVFELGAMSLKTFELIPPRYALALLRATLTHKDKHKCQEDQSEEVAAEFKRLLCQSHSPYAVPDQADTDSRQMN